MKQIKVYTQGTFDVFHVGHLNIIQRAAEVGNQLLVGVNSDEAVVAHKGHATIIPFEQRSEIVGSIKGVSDVIKSQYTVDIPLLQRMQIDICVLGTDLQGKTCKLGIKDIEKAGITMMYLPYTKGISTTQIIEKIRGIVEEKD